MNYQRILLIGVATGIAAIGVTGVLRSQPVTKRESEARVDWLFVSADAASRDTKILDAVVSDVLTNPVLDDIGKGYGKTTNRTVSYSGFPVSYAPAVPGYQFEILSDSNRGSGLKFTLSLGGIWIDRPPTKSAKDDFRILRPQAPAERGVLLSIYSSGGPTTNGNVITDTIGGCMVGYDARQTSGGWEVGLSGFLDP
jgi:hypothetical protein